MTDRIPGEFVDSASPESRSAQVKSWIRRHRILLLAMFGIAAAVMIAAIADQITADVRAENALGRLNTSMDESQVLAALGQPSSRGTWTGSYGSGTTLDYNFPSVVDRMMQDKPRQVEIIFRLGESQLFEIRTRAANSKSSRVVSSRDR